MQVYPKQVALAKLFQPYVGLLNHLNGPLNRHLALNAALFLPYARVRKPPPLAVPPRVRHKRPKYAPPRLVARARQGAVVLPERRVHPDKRVKMATHLAQVQIYLLKRTSPVPITILPSDFCIRRRKAKRAKVRRSFIS